jgi:hypothetical protein
MQLQCRHPAIRISLPSLRNRPTARPFRGTHSAEYIVPSCSCLLEFFFFLSFSSFTTQSFLTLFFALCTYTMLWPSSLTSVVVLAASASAQSLDHAQSPPSYPSPWMRGGNGWQDAYAKAQAFVAQLTLLEKVNLTTGVG